MNIITTNTAWSLGSVSANIAFQVIGAHSVEFARSSNSSIVAGFRYDPGFGDRGSLDDLFPGSIGSNVYVRSSADSLVVFG